MVRGRPKHAIAKAWRFLGGSRALNNRMYPISSGSRIGVATHICTGRTLPRPWRLAQRDAATPPIAPDTAPPRRDRIVAAGALVVLNPGAFLSETS